MTVIASAAGVQSLKCRNCGQVWDRPAQAGRPPLYCEDCRRMGPALKAPTAPVKVEHTPIAGGRHESFPILLTTCQARVPAYLNGPAGSGKTTAARQVAESLGLSLRIESCNPQMSKYDLLGFVNVATGDFTEGCLYDPFKNGGVVLLDEMDSSNGEVLTTANALASCRVGETVTFPNGENVARHPDFVLIGGGNTLGDGASDRYMRQQLDAATLDRFAFIEWGYDLRLEFIAAGPDMAEWVTRVQAIRKAAESVHADMLVSPRASVNGADLLRAGMSRVMVENLTVWNRVSEDTRRTVEAALRNF